MREGLEVNYPSKLLQNLILQMPFKRRGLKVEYSISMISACDPLFPVVANNNCTQKNNRTIFLFESDTSTQMTEVTWAPIFTTHAVDKPFPKTAARPSCDHHIWSKCYNQRVIYYFESISTGKAGKSKSHKRIPQSGRENKDSNVGYQLFYYHKTI